MKPEEHIEVHAQALWEAYAAVAGRKAGGFYALHKKEQEGWRAVAKASVRNAPHRKGPI